MTPKLTRLTAALRQHIEEAEKATAPKWDNENGPYVYARIPGGRPNGEYILRVSCANGAGPKLSEAQNTANAAFIAHARTMSPLACKGLLLAIEGIEFFQSQAETSQRLIERHKYTTLLNEIESLFPDEN